MPEEIRVTKKDTVVWKQPSTRTVSLGRILYGTECATLQIPGRKRRDLTKKEFTSIRAMIKVNIETDPDFDSDVLITWNEILTNREERDNG